MQVGIAAPVLTALVKGTQKESVVSEMYGGAGGERAATDEVYSAIGDVCPFVSAQQHSTLQNTICKRTRSKMAFMLALSGILLSFRRHIEEMAVFIS